MGVPLLDSLNYNIFNVSTSFSTTRSKRLRKFVKLFSHINEELPLNSSAYCSTILWKICVLQDCTYCTLVVFTCSDDHLNKNHMEHKTQCCHTKSIKILPRRVRRNNVMRVYSERPCIYITLNSSRSVIICFIFLGLFFLSKYTYILVVCPRHSFAHLDMMCQPPDLTHRGVCLDKIGGQQWISKIFQRRPHQWRTDKLNGWRWLLDIYVTVTHKIIPNNKKLCQIRIHHYKIH